MSKRLLLFFLCTLLCGVLFSTETHAGLVLHEGSVVNFEGSGFGVAPGQNAQVCFSQSMCSSVGNINQVVVSWSDTKIQLQVPNIILPAQGELSISTFPQGDGAQAVWKSLGAYSFSSLAPVVTSSSPQEIIPEKTVFTILGHGFGDNYVAGKTQICVKGACLSDDTFLSSYFVSWSDTKIELKIPSMGVSGDVELTLNIWAYADKTSGGDVYFPTNIPVRLSAQPDPVLMLASPLDVIPLKTILTISGRGFGDSYDSAKNQICFGGSCIRDEDMPLYLKSWSDTEVRILVPSFANHENALQVSLRVFVPSKHAYDHVVYPQFLSITHIPEIERYYPSMESDTSYTITGSFLGEQSGQVLLGSIFCEVLSWSDTAVTFRTPMSEFAGKLTLISHIGNASENVPVRLHYTPKISKDAYSQYQDYLQKVGVVDAWKYTEGDPSLVVAVIDGGVDQTQEDLAGAIWTNTKEIPGNGKDDDHNGYVDDVSGWDFVHHVSVSTTGSTHGTMVASVIAAQKDNRKGLVGVAPKVKIMSLSVMTSTGDGKGGSIDVDASIEAIKYAIQNGAKIINLSFGGPYTSTYDTIVQYAYDHNVLLVVAAGNDGQVLTMHSQSPACNKNGEESMVGITSLTKNLAVSTFSNVGSCVDFALPGQDILVALPTQMNPDDPYSFADGTSFAAPIFSGIGALVWSMHPDWNVMEVLASIKNTSKALSSIDLRYAGMATYGIPNAYLAMQAQKPVVAYAPRFDSTFTHVAKSEQISLDTPVTTPISTKVSDGMAENGKQVFTDVLTSDHYGEAISFLKTKNILQGYPDGSFRVEQEINRAEFLKILLLSKQVKPSSGEYHDCFPDVQKEWYASYVCFAYTAGMITGYPDGTFKPGQYINRAEAIKMVVNVFGGNINTFASFSDVPKNSWYNSYIGTAESWGVLEEKAGGIFSPASSMKRGQMAYILYHLAK